MLYHVTRDFKDMCLARMLRARTSRSFNRVEHVYKAFSVCIAKHMAVQNHTCLYTGFTETLQ